MPGEIFAQHLQPFAGHRRLEAGEARYVGPWVCDVGHEPAAFGIRDLDEDDRNRIGRPLQGQSARCGMRDNHIGGKRHQLLGEGGDAIRTSRRPAVVDAQIASIDPSQGLQAVVQPGDHQLRLLIAFADARQDRDPPHALLSARRQWPRHRRAAEKRDDVAAPFHSITSSARPSSVRGTVSPSALAVLRLMISSTFVACCTGRSAGFSPLRTRPV